MFLFKLSTLVFFIVFLGKFTFDFNVNDCPAHIRGALMIVHIFSMALFSIAIALFVKLLI